MFSRRTCGQHDSDPCRDWSSPTACASDETCTNGACACDDARCTQPPARTCSTINGSPTERSYPSTGTCGPTDDCEYTPTDEYCFYGCGANRCKCDCGDALQCCWATAVTDQDKTGCELLQIKCGLQTKPSDVDTSWVAAKCPNLDCG
jgi:hypothetical protein